MSNERIQELVKKVQTGDETSFALLYDEFADRIYAFIRIKTFGEGEAEDILQEVFLKAWKNCQSLTLADLNFSAWLYKIASNTVNDYFRKKYRRPQTTTLEDAADLASTSNATDTIHLQHDSETIALALDKLPAHYKEVMELRFLQEFSIAETSKILNKNSVTVRVWQHRAIKQLEQIFKDHERFA